MQTSQATQQHLLNMQTSFATNHLVKQKLQEFWNHNKREIWAGFFSRPNLKVKGFNGIYNLDKRLKRIDNSYVLSFQNGSFGLFVKRGLNLTKEMDFGSSIDTQILKKVILTRKENIAKTLQKIDEFNAKTQENALFKLLQDTKDKVHEVVSYADKTGKDLSENNIQKILNG